jgi:hypothetical protein
VGATPLFGLYVPRERFERLRSRQPMARIGYSMYVYDLRRSLAPQGYEPAGAGTYDDADERVVYTTGWHRDLGFPAAAGGTLTYAEPTGSQVQFDFWGTEITWVHTKTTNRGIAEVRLDGVRRGEVDLYSKAVLWQQRLTFGALKEGPHRLVIRSLGRRNPASAGTYVDVDEFVVR